ncbi:glycogen debranching enzyme [Microthyrium microscopicum]|uniref:Glycogen debranching enzyme n=1 Tax=Microthyrium microscopicum TaxID=703497 RepID=A0A6A6UCS3_9PEZI|nr:glycogen debranching enzyme [Microthyrium microscopicum]
MAATAPPRTQNVYVLPLTDNGAPDVVGSYIYLPPPTTPCYSLRFSILGTSSICREGSLWVNIPAKGEEFRRDNYKEYKLIPDFNGRIEINMPIYQAGSFGYKIRYSPLPEFAPHPVTPPEPTETPIYYIDICPKLQLNGAQIPLDAISIISVLSKLVGPYPGGWNEYLNGIAERGYNMIHFTPLNPRGESNSPYSIYDQLAFDKDLFPHGEDDIAHLTTKMEEEYGLLGLTDVVFNHTANNSKWLQHHPEAGYSVKTAPHLEPALVLDTSIMDFGDRLGELGCPTNIQSADDLKRLMEGIKKYCVDANKLWEFYVINVDRDTSDVLTAWKAGRTDFSHDEAAWGERGLSDTTGIRSWPLKRKADFVIQQCMTGLDRLGERFRRRVIASRVAAFLSVIIGRYDTRNLEHPDENLVEETCKQLLNEINLQFYKEYDMDAATIIDQLSNRIKYVRLDDHGPKWGPFSKEHPIIESYFTRLPYNKITQNHDPSALALVNNGWVWAADAMRDNAGPKSKAYLKREVIVWGDCVKLRYGKGREDNPWLWDHIAKYTRLMAKYFVGFRIDNCHSTPIHLAEYMLDQARTVRPDLLVCAELFSGSEEMDFVFCKRLGISCLIREAMQAYSTKELSRLVHKHAGPPIGSFEMDGVINAVKSPGSITAANGAPLTREIIHTIKQSPIHALFMDCTHDNETPAQKRDARDTLPNAALVAMCAAATGSVAGYDECYPELIDLVHETRMYSSPYANKNQLKVQAAEGGIGNIKKLLNQIHVLMGKDGYSETFIHHDNEYITVHRVHPQSRKGYFLIAHTAFPGYGNGNGGFPPVRLPGTRAKAIGAWMFEVDSSEDAKKSAMGDKVLRGLPSRTRDIRGVTITHENGETVIQVRETFPPGSIALFDTWIPGAEHSEGLDKFVTRGAAEACQDLNLADLNYLLYRCETEERDATGGTDGTYNIPNYGNIVYAGLQGWISVLKDIIPENNLGHPLCDHLRSGQWAMDYIIGRLENASKQNQWKRLSAPATWLRERFDACRKLPSFLLPRYFAMVVNTMYSAATDRAIEQMDPNIRKGNDFLKGLSLVSLQVTGYMNSTSLYPNKQVPSLAAGLPHFANDWARCWGRDIMIAMRGLLIAPGRRAEAIDHICAFASVVKHGLVPNLLSKGELPRYNSRDSPWFFLQSVQDYCKIVPDGISLLSVDVPRRFLPNDDTWFPWDDPRAYSKSSTIAEVCHEIMQRHASGLDFREYNAGPNLDSQMKDEGFNIKVFVDPETGFVHGGNQHNCGTWMDKMGESVKAGSKGVPGTPRDGAAVEITGMLFSAANWLDSLYQAGQFAYSGVTWADGSKKSYSDWAALIKANFERCFWVPRDRADDAAYDIDATIINRRGIYKDLYKSGKPYEDYQLRPNFPIAMCVAPELFDPSHALHALWVADKNLRGPIGMRTLDPSDLNYRPNYINSDDSDDFATAKGRNYHQGPEWCWPLGFFLRAFLRFGLQRATTEHERTEVYQQVTRRLEGCMKQLKESPWAGLTELTNKDGAFCGDSCPTQAWSAGCLIDLYEEAMRLEGESTQSA